uniref:SUMO-interacting motif-containing protein 1 n=1 Tax=Knipowitschia caucasica TaxID=637954 RepID=A0AAV2MJ61_KNICA
MVEAAEMASVITLSSDSDSDSEVEIVGYFSNKNVTFPLSWVRVEVDALHVQSNNNYIKPRSNSGVLDLTGHDNNIGMQAHKTFLADAESHAVMLCSRSLSMVYSCIEVSYPEGTLQLLSDLLKPGYYPPKDITLHLLKDILLNPQCPLHFCRKAFSLLIQTQRNKFVDKESVSWNWEMLNDVMENKELRPEIVCMFLNYVAQTLEDDFNTKKSTSAPNESIVKVMLSFDKQFPQIRDVCTWLFSVIVKSTDDNHSKGDQISFSRMVVRFQKMLSLALEVDSSPAIASAKLSQELFHVLISNAPLRPQRMLLLDSLQSKRLRCKLLEHLLDYSCPVKTSVPMSLSLLLHFLKNCILSPDPNDGTDKWRRWEELLCHLWTLLLSYSNAMKDYLSGSLKEQRHTTGTWIYKPEDVLTICAVREAAEAFMSRSQDDIGEALPLHVEESLTYLQDYLMEKCQH